MTDSLADRLQVMHERLIDEPLPEELERASCGPQAKHLMHAAMHSAAAGATAEQWRAWAHSNVPDASPKQLSEAEECMRSSGLWPWND